jgi:hypothetical protein
MVLGSVITPILSGVSFTKSPRYGGGDGPLYSTVNGFLDRIASGDLAVIRQLDSLRKTDVDKEQWQKLWDEMMPLQPLTDAQVALIKQLDPTKSSIIAHGGEVIHAQPGVAPPNYDQVVRGLIHVVERSDPPTAPAPGNPLSIVRSSSGGMPLWFVLVLAAGAGYWLYKATKGSK